MTITQNDGAVRTIAVDAPVAEVTAAERAAGPVAVAVVQIGTNGASPAATILV